MLLREGIWRAVPQLKLLPLDVLSCKWLCSQNRGAKSRAAFDGDEVRPLTLSSYALFFRHLLAAACTSCLCTSCLPPHSPFIG